LASVYRYTQQIYTAYTTIKTFVNTNIILDCNKAYILRISTDVMLGPKPDKLTTSHEAILFHFWELQDFAR